MTRIIYGKSVGWIGLTVVEDTCVHRSGDLRKPSDESKAHWIGEGSTSLI